MLLLMLCNGYKTTKRSERRQEEERDIENDGETRAKHEHWYSVAFAYETILLITCSENHFTS